MATGLDVAAGVAGLVTLTDIILDRTYRTIKACKNAGEDSRRLLREVQALHGILTSVERLSRHATQASLDERIPPALRTDCHNMLNGIICKLEKADPQSESISRPEKVLRRLRWPFTAGETQEVLAQIERYKQAMDLSITVNILDELFTASHQQELAHRSIKSVEESLRRLTRVSINAEKQRILGFYHAYDAEQIHFKNLELHQPGTGNWLLDGSVFQTWLQTSNSKLWIRGIPGAGKTIMTAAAIERFISQASSNHAVAIFYCDYRQNISVEVMLACLLGQLARQSEHVLAKLSDSYLSTTNPITLLNRNKILDDIERAAAAFDQVTVVIEAVDECAETYSVLEALIDTARRCFNVRVMVTSRDEPKIRSQVQSFTPLVVAAQQEDIELYTIAEIELRSRKDELRIRSPELKDDILRTLVKRADGMFRWVTCQLDHLCKLRTDAKRRVALQQLPPDLYSTYDRILEHAAQEGTENAQIAQRVLRWLFECPGQLDDTQLCEALSVDPESRTLDPDAAPEILDILLCCGSLVQRGAEGNLELAHFTVKEYLASEHLRLNNNLSQFYCTAEIALEYQASTCLRYLLANEFEQTQVETVTQLEEFLASMTFYEYAVKICQLYATTPNTLKLLEELFNSCQRLELWKKTYAHICLEREPDTIMVAGILPVVHSGLIASRIRSTSVDSDSALISTTELAEYVDKQHFAALLLQPDILKMLSSKGMDLNKDEGLGTALHFALCGDDLFAFAAGRSPRQMTVPDEIKSQRRKVLRVLFKLQANVNAPLPFPTICPWDTRCTPCCFATRTGNHECIIDAGPKLDDHTVQSLIRIGISTIDQKSRDSLRQLPSATQTDDLFVTFREMLGASEDNVCPSMEISSTTGNQLTTDKIMESLCWACSADASGAVVRLLSNHQLDLNFSCTRFDEPPLHVAVKRASTNAMACLVAHGADLNAYHEGCTAIYDALSTSEFYERDQNLALLEKAVDLGVDFYAGCENDRATCLFAWATLAKSHGDSGRDILAFILSSCAGIAFHQVPKTGETLLHEICHQDAVERFRELREVLSTVEMRRLFLMEDIDGRQAMHTAACAHSSDTLRAMHEWILDNGLECPLASDGRSILHSAVQNLEGGATILTELVDLGLDPTCVAIDGSTPLHDAVLALEDIRNSRTHFNTILHDFTELLNVLELHGCMINSKRADGKTATKLLCDIIAASDCGSASISACSPCRVRLQCLHLLLNICSEGVAALDLSRLAGSVLRRIGTHADREESIGPRSPATRLIRSRSPSASGSDRSFRSFEDTSTSCGSVYDGEDIVIDDDPGNTITECLATTLFFLLRKVSDHELKDNKIPKGQILLAATTMNYQPALTRLLEAGIDVDQRIVFLDLEISPLEAFCYWKAQSDHIQRAISMSSYVQRRTQAGLTLIHLLVQPCEYSQKIEFAEEDHKSLEHLLDAGLHIDSREVGQASPLLSVVENINVEPVLALLACGADTSLADARGMTPLMKACHLGRPSAVKILMQHDAHHCTTDVVLPVLRLDICNVSTVNVGLLQLAVMSRSLSTVEEVLLGAEGREQQCESRYGPSSLWLSCWLGVKSIARYLINKGHDINAAEESTGLTCLQAASINGHVKIASMLLDAFVDIRKADRHHRTALNLAQVSHSSKTEDLLLRHVANSKDSPAHLSSELIAVATSRGNRFGSLVQCIQKGNVEDITRFILMGKDLATPLACGCTPLLCAMREQQDSIGACLVSAGVPLTGYVCSNHGKQYVRRNKKRYRYDYTRHKLIAGFTAFELASTDEELRQTLIAILVRVTGDERTRNLPSMIFNAAAEGNLPALTNLLELEGPLVSAGINHLGTWPLRSQNSRTRPLHLAVEQSNVPLIEKLAQAGADLDARDEELRTPLHIVTFDGNKKLVKKLIDLGANVNRYGEALETPLHVAVSEKQTEMASFLADLGADLMSTDRHGQRPINVAAGIRNMELVRMLKHKGARLTEETGRDSDLVHFIKGTTWAGRSYALNGGQHLEARNYLRGWSRDQSSELRMILKLLSDFVLLENLLRCNGGMPPLHEAAAHGSRSILLLLIEAGAPVNQETLCDGSPATPLSLACKYGRLGCVKLLVRAGAVSGSSCQSWANDSLRTIEHRYIIRWLLCDQYVEQAKLDSYTFCDLAPVSLSATPVGDYTFARIRRVKQVPWNAKAFIPLGKATAWLRQAIDATKIGPFTCAADGHIYQTRSSCDQ